MSLRAGTTLAALWRESWFFRASVALSVVGVLYLIYR